MRSTFLVCTILSFLCACSRGNLKPTSANLFSAQEMVDFGDVNVGTHQEYFFTIVNRGAELLQLSQVKFDGLGGVFQIEVDKNTVALNEAIVVKVVFSPMYPVSYNTNIQFYNNSENLPVFAFVAKGRGVSPDLCAGIVCDQPPTEVRCVDAQTSASYESVGTCDNGTCTYALKIQQCAWGCQVDTGFCKNDPCENVVCDTPPSAQCFLSTGTCVDGACVYTPQNDIVCDDGNLCTVGDTCMNGVCAGSAKTCDSAPSNVCSDLEHLRTFESAGACMPETGACDYASTEQLCALGCQNNLCVSAPVEPTPEVRIEVDLDKLQYQDSQRYTDARDAVIELMNPALSKCSRLTGSRTAWNEIFGSCVVEQNRDSFTKNQILIHKVNAQGNGLYSVYLTYANSCSVLESNVGCRARDHLIVTTRVFIEGQLRARCFNRLYYGISSDFEHFLLNIKRQNIVTLQNLSEQCTLISP